MRIADRGQSSSASSLPDPRPSILRYNACMETPPNSTGKETGRVAGVDYGTRRIGLAITDKRRTIASPMANFTRQSPEADARWFVKQTQAEEITRYVVGLPVHLDGNESQKSHEAREFGKWLAEVTGKPVEFFDERFTSAQAEAMLEEAGLTKKQRRARLDMLAAQIMLQAWLEAGLRGESSAAGLDG